MRMEKPVDSYLSHSSLHLFSPLEMEKLRPGGYFSSSKTERRGDILVAGKGILIIIQMPCLIHIQAKSGCQTIPKG